MAHAKMAHAVSTRPQGRRRKVFKPKTGSSKAPSKTAEVPPRPLKRRKVEEENASASDSTSDSENSVVDASSDDETRPATRPGKLESYKALLHVLGCRGQASKRTRGDGETAPKALEADPREERDSPSASVAGEDDPLAEPADGGEEEEDEAAESDGECDALDPFDVHVEVKNDEEFQKKITAAQDGVWSSSKTNLSGLGPATLTWPGSSDAAFKLGPPLASPAQIPHLKQKLQAPAQKVMPQFDEIQKALQPVLFNYHDLFFYARTPENASSIRNLACLHALNHIFKSADRVLKNDSRLAQAADDDAEYRDQGFTRPKVLFLLETRQNCARHVDTLLALSEPSQTENKHRFAEAYSSSGNRFVGTYRPADFIDLFSGNADNDFRIGLKLTRKTAKLFAPFYTSDIILASPLGLRRALSGRDANSPPQSDFLSSIELVIIDQADAMQMQNWTHVLFALSHLNLTPQSSHGCDFTRVRHAVLDGHARHVRQTILLSAFATPELHALARTHAPNVGGRVTHQPSHPRGAIDALTPSPPRRMTQTFHRFPAPTPQSDPDARFAFFTAEIAPLLHRRIAATQHPHGAGILLVAPAYPDFVRLRNHFSPSSSPHHNNTTHISTAAVSEYTPPPAAHRAQSLFQTGRRHMLLYSARAHHFRRARLRGVRAVVWYGVPANAAFYAEVCGFLGLGLDGDGDGDGEVRVLFSRWDGVGLERVVGTGRVGAMLGGRGERFEFV